MKVKNYYIPLLITIIFLITACSEENERVPLINDPIPPGIVKNVRAESLPGAIKLTYDLPDDQNLSYVKAECIIGDVTREVKASSYLNTLTIQGFADTSEYSVKVYSVNRSEVESEPVMIKVNPLSPPFRDVFENIDLFETFGGAAVLYENPTEADLAISLIYIDSIGYWNPGITAYTKLKKGDLSLRGFDAENTTFGVFISDRWGNTTDTIIKDLTPIFEKEIDKVNFREVKLPGDEPFAWGWVMPNLWNNSTTGNGFHTAVTGRWPQHITFDLGVQEGVTLSRFKIWQRDGANYIYNDRNIKKFEIWGSMSPNPSGEFDESWTLLLDTEIVKPSGLPIGQNSQEDIEAILAGHEFEFPLGLPDVRYIRIRVTENWANTQSFFVMEVSFYGTELSNE